MVNKFKHIFENKPIKEAIEYQFYKLASQKLGEKASATIVTGPDVLRHIANFYSLFNTKKLRICEIADDTYKQIKEDIKGIPGITLNRNIADYGSRLLDLDVCNLKQLEQTKPAILKQISNYSTNCRDAKGFIITFGLRTSGTKICYKKALNSYLGLVGGSIKKITKKHITCTDRFNYVKELKLHFHYKGRIKYVKCYLYSTGGGPMITCLTIYK